MGNTTATSREARTGTEALPASGRFLRSIPFDFARRHLLLGAGTHDTIERLLVAETTPGSAAWNTCVLLEAWPPRETADAERLARMIDEAYAAAMEREGASKAEAKPGADGVGAAESIEDLLAAADRDLLSTEGKGEVVRLVDALLFEALGKGASDIHVQPLADRTLVRYRVDGVLHVARELPKSVTPAVVSRIKVMGRMDIAERRIPQDGRATVTIGQERNAARDQGGRQDGDRGRAVDLRISTLPTSYGERAVIRLLDTERGLRLADFDTLGMPEDVRIPFLDRAGRANGIVLVTGPTGSGKTTTLYATLKWLSQSGRGGELNVMTIEDPIEYELSTVGVAVSQAQVNTKKGVTFATGLRHILRQDPDVVMVGEIRDAETARIAIQASLTGHLVLSTLHTNDAASAVTRLVDLGVEPYLVAASLSAVLAQRLVRRVHGPCRGEGCGACLGSGYAGRTGLYELLVVSERLRELVSRGASAAEVRGAARTGGMRCLHERGRDLVAAGVTSDLEVERVAHGVVDDPEPQAAPQPAARREASLASAGAAVSGGGLP